MDTSKRCGKCKELKPLSEFCKSSASADGLQAWCKPCTNRAKAKYRATEKGRATIARYAQTERYKEVRKVSNQTESVKEAKRRYAKSERGKESRRRYAQSEKGRQTIKANTDKRRGEINERHQQYKRSEQGKQAYRRWRVSESGREYCRNRLRRWRGANPEKDAAHGAVAYAVRLGKLPHVASQRCVDCGKVAEIYHHHSYDEQYHLDVTPMCFLCHKRLHRSLSQTMDS